MKKIIYLNYFKSLRIKIVYFQRCLLKFKKYYKNFAKPRENIETSLSATAKRDLYETYSCKTGIFLSNQNSLNEILFVTFDSTYLGIKFSHLPSYEGYHTTSMYLKATIKHFQ